MEKKKMKRKLNWTIGLVNVVFVALFTYARVKTEIPAVLLLFILLVLEMVALNVLSRFFYSGKNKAVMEELDLECEKEEEQEFKKGEKPDAGALWLMVAVLFVLTVGNGIEVFNRVALQDGEGGANVLPECVGMLTMLLCLCFIGVILYNVRKRKVFDPVNARMIYAVGATMVASTLLQMEVWDTTSMVPNSTVQMYNLLFGTFVIFFGKLFDIAVKMKDERDLTI